MKGFQQTVNSQPIYKFRLRLGVVDRTRGEVFPIQGRGFVVESCDYPVLISVNEGDSSIERAIIAKPGAVFVGDFTSITIRHPQFLVSSSATEMGVSLVVFAGAVMEPTKEGFSCAHGVAVLQSTDGLTATYSLRFPPGAAMIDSLNVSVSATTVTGASFSFLENAGSGFMKNPALTNFASAPNMTVGLRESRVGSFFTYSAGPLPIPSSQNTPEGALGSIIVTGTGIVIAGAGMGFYAGIR